MAKNPMKNGIGNRKKRTRAMAGKVGKEWDRKYWKSRPVSQR